MTMTVILSFYFFSLTQVYMKQLAEPTTFACTHQTPNSTQYVRPKGLLYANKPHQGQPIFFRWSHIPEFSAHYRQ